MKNRILSRIQEELNRLEKENGEMGEPNTANIDAQLKILNLITGQTKAYSRCIDIVIEESRKGAVE
jgi:hypothetical protein